ncbi:FAD-dependent oxidoreductase [Mangrovicoccus sp. HB182678]|uniref:FAD-dependent oxidoreductase n=1 Tax=Mangrovicoccus algicola TaxID=2771008 RepID=A0A8J7D0R7_9RHOB|nr:FAD-dependent oxidoreductase [Mangrovicoccus algicola]
MLIVGGGPAGLAAARRLRALGREVHLLEREPETGGIPRHCAHSPYGFREFRRPMLGPAYARALGAAAQQAGARIHVGVTVTRLLPGGTVEVTSPAGPARITARAVILAMGARETARAPRMIGGTKPGGILNTGALQGLVHLQGLRPFRRPVILGTELVAFSALLTCRQAGIRPLAMIEPASRITARQPAGMLPRAMGVPLRLGTALVAIHGSDRVEAVTLSHDGTRSELETDGVILTGGFRPETALIRGSHLRIDPGTRGPEIDQYGRCSDPAYFAAGNLLRGVETAGHCWSEGRAVADAAHRALAGELPEIAETPFAVEGAGLAWHLPQRLAPDAAPPAFRRLSMRAAGPLSGRISAGRASASVSTRPERRISLPLPAPDAVLRIET